MSFLILGICRCQWDFKKDILLVIPILIWRIIILLEATIYCLFYEMISEECREIFNAKYTDARTLTGMNCLMVVLMSLAKIGDSIMILSSQSGGHASVKPICERLGLKVSDVPYDFQNFDLDYEKLNHRLKEGQIDYILLAPSDIISPLEVNRIELGNTVLLYDVSQMLGLIGAGVIENPLAGIKNIVMFGGTHKTFQVRHAD